jgi:beta-glucosidase
MCAYNAYDGQPCCGSDLLMLDILRNRWGYQGMVVSDCWAINDFFMENHHATHPTPAAAAADAVIHSTDLECGPVYENLTKALEQGLITQEQIDTSLRRVLRGWFELGMLDPADRVPWSNLPYSVVDSPDHREQAVKVARESMVLLKNDNETLPLNKNIKKIAILGPNAADSVMLWGNYNGIPSSTVTIAEGIRRKLPLAEIIYDKGCDLVDPWTRTSLYDNLKSAPQGEKGLEVRFYNTSTFSGEAAATLSTPQASITAVTVVLPWRRVWTGRIRLHVFPACLPHLIREKWYSRRMHRMVTGYLSTGKRYCLARDGKQPFPPNMR